MLSDSSMSDAISPVLTRRKPKKQWLPSTDDESNDDTPIKKPKLARRQRVTSTSDSSSDSSVAGPSRKKFCRTVVETDESDTDSSDSDEVLRPWLPKEVAGKKKLVISDSDYTDSEVENLNRHNNVEAKAESSNSSDSEGAERCIICFKTLRTPVANPSNCNHTFHSECLSTWSKTSNTCPIDRVKYTAIHIRGANGDLISKRDVTTPPPQDHNPDLEPDDPTFCEVCNQHDRESEMLLCDRCEAGYHMDCLTPPLSQVPSGDWFCPDCSLLHNDVDEDEVRDLLTSSVILETRMRRRSVSNRSMRIQPRTRAVQRLLNTIRLRANEQEPSSSAGIRNSTTTRRKKKSRRKQSTRYKVELVTTEDGTTVEVKVGIRSCRKRKRKLKRKPRLNSKAARRESIKKGVGYVSARSHERSSSGLVTTLDINGSRPQFEYFSGCEAEDELDEESGGLVSLRRARTVIRGMAERKQIAAQIFASRPQRSVPRVIQTPALDILSSILPDEPKSNEDISKSKKSQKTPVPLPKKSEALPVRTTPGSTTGQVQRTETNHSHNHDSGSQYSSNTQSSSYQGVSPLQPPPQPPFARLYDDEDIDLYADIEPPTCRLAPPPEPPPLLLALEGDDGGSSPEDTMLVIDDQPQVYDPDEPTSPPSPPVPQPEDIMHIPSPPPPEEPVYPKVNINLDDIKLPSPVEPDNDSECPNMVMYSKLSRTIARRGSSDSIHSSHDFEETKEENDVCNTISNKQNNIKNVEEEDSLKEDIVSSVNEKDTSKEDTEMCIDEEEDKEEVCTHIEDKLKEDEDAGIDEQEKSKESEDSIDEEEKLKEDKDLCTDEEDNLKIGKDICSEEILKENNLKDELDDIEGDEKDEVEPADEVELADEEMKVTTKTEEDETEKKILSEDVKDETCKEKIESQNDDSLKSEDEDKFFIKKETKSESLLDDDMKNQEEEMVEIDKVAEKLESTVTLEDKEEDAAKEEEGEESAAESKKENEDEKQENSEKSDLMEDTSFEEETDGLNESQSQDNLEEGEEPDLEKECEKEPEGDVLELGCEEGDRDGLVDITDEEMSTYEKNWEMENDRSSVEKRVGLEGLETEAISECEDTLYDEVPGNGKAPSEPVSKEEGEIVIEERHEAVAWKKLSKGTKERSYREKDVKKDYKEKKKEKKPKEKRKELERYDVRKIISDKPKKRKTDEFGRDISNSRSRSTSLRSESRTKRKRSREKRRSYSKARSKSKERSRGRSKSRTRVRSRSRSRGRSWSRSRGRSAGRSRVRSSRSRSKRRLRSRSIRREKNRGRPRSKDRKRQRKASTSCSSCSCSSCERERRGTRKLTVIVPNKNNTTPKKSKDKKKGKDRRKDRRRRAGSPVPSKEVFTSGDNILVSVNFKSSKSGEMGKKDGKRRREDDSSRRKKDKSSKENQPLRSVVTTTVSVPPSMPKPRKRDEMRHRINVRNLKPVAIIDLDQSPFREQTPSPKEVIILSDSDHEDKRQPAEPPIQTISTGGPKTPPEPHIKFSISSKPQIRNLSNPLLDSVETEEREADDEEPAMTGPHKGPNTPPEPPVPYDPFEPTKSRSPTPGPDTLHQVTPPIDIPMSNRTPEQQKVASPPKIQHESPKTPSPLQSPPKPVEEIPVEKPKLPVYTPAMTTNCSDDMDMGGGGGDSPYSPGSTEGDDLFEPPLPQITTPTPIAKVKPRAISQKQHTNTLKLTPSPLKKRPLNKLGALKNMKGKKEIGIKLDEDQLKILDDLPNSAVEMQVKDKFLKKLNRQERVVEEVKLVLKPHYAKKHVTKEEYKDILRKAVPKICHNRSGEINPLKIQHLIEAYVKKYRHKKKKMAAASGILPLKPKPKQSMWC